MKPDREVEQAINDDFALVVKAFDDPEQQREAKPETNAAIVRLVQVYAIALYRFLTK